MMGFCINSMNLCINSTGICINSTSIGIDSRRICVVIVGAHLLVITVRSAWLSFCRGFLLLVCQSS